MGVSRARVGEIEIEWEEHGNAARTLVLVHGFTGARSDFESHFDALAQTRRVIAADQRGHGGSSNTGDGSSYTLDALANDLAGFFDVAVSGPVDVLGHSMGGMVALRLVLRRPDLVRSLILMDTAAEAPGGLEPPTELGALVREHGVRKVIEVAGRTPEHACFVARKGADWVERDSERRLSAMDEEAFIALLPRVFQGDDLLPRLGEICCPTTVLVGAKDALFIPPSERLAAGIAGARLEVIDDAFHSPQHTHPEEWLTKVRAHLEWVDAVSA